MAKHAGVGHTEIVPRDAPSPGMRYISGLTTYDEALSFGRWVGRYWSAAGFIEKEQRAEARASRIDVPVQALRLNIDGQSLHFGWDAVGTSVEEEPQGSHGVVRLRHQVRPVALSVHTHSDGTGFLERWLEITNTGQEPAALASVAPWAGLVGEVARWRETVALDEPVFTLGYFGEYRWGAEGAFDWVGLRPGMFRIQSQWGWSGHGAPFFVVRNNVTGEHLVGCLGWSGDWAIDFRYDPDPDGDA